MREPREIPERSRAEVPERSAPAHGDVLLAIASERARALSPPNVVAQLCWLIVVEFTEPLSARTLPVSIAALALAGLIWGFARRAPVGRRSHALCALLWMTPMMASLAGAYDSGAPMYGTLITLEMLGAVVMLDTRWTVGVLIAALAAWIAVSLHTTAHPAMQILTAVTGAVLGLTVQILIRRALLRHATISAELQVQLAERLRLEERLVHSQRMEAVGTLSAGLAHDMNNVLAAITSFASLIHDDIAPDHRADLEQIMDQASRGAALTRGLLAFSRRGQYRKQAIRIDDLVGDVLPLLARTLPRSITLREQLHGGASCIEGDTVQLRQVLVHLAANAADAMQGKGTITIAVDAVALGAAAAAGLELTAGDYARLRISDTGVGMDPATLRRAFEPFFTTKAAGSGTGLGLSYAWGVVQAHHGVIGAESTPGTGTTFTIHLPLSTVILPTRAAPVAAVSPELRQIGTVLVVDDEPAVRAGTVRILERMGLSALQARNGEEALRQYHDHASTIDLVILDMGMPVMGGAECFRKLRETSRVPVLIASGYAEDAEVQEIVARGASLIEKPFPAGDLSREVTLLLNGKSSHLVR